MPDPMPPGDIEIGADRKFATLFRELRECIPPQLLGEQECNRLLDRLNELPEAEVASGCGFEFRIDEPKPAADFFVVVRPGGTLSQFYIERGEAIGTGPAAALARHLVRMHANGPSQVDSVADWNDGMTLEYDVAEIEEHRRSEPGVFLKMRLNRSPSRKSPHHCRPRVAAAGISTAVGWKRDEGEERAVERVFEALPSQGEVAHIGGLPGRTPRAVRLLVQRLDVSEVPKFLERIDWPGDSSRVVSILGDFKGVHSRFRLGLDVTPQGVSSRLGGELFVHEHWDRDDWQRTDIGDWRPVVELLQARGWCLPEKARGLLAWPKIEHLYGSKGVHLLYMGINHVKFLIDHENLRFKVYTGLHCSPLK